MRRVSSIARRRGAERFCFCFFEFVFFFAGERSEFVWLVCRWVACWGPITVYGYDIVSVVSACCRTFELLLGVCWVYAGMPRSFVGFLKSAIEPYQQRKRPKKKNAVGVCWAPRSFVGFSESVKRIILTAQEPSKKQYKNYC